MRPPKHHFLMIMSGPEDGRIFEISKDQITIGRNDENDVVMNDDPYMKTAHALLIRREGQFFVVSASSADQKTNVTIPVTIGRIFTLGATEFSIKAK